MVLRLLIFLVLGVYLAEGQYVNLTQYPGELCNSKCIPGKTKICYYHWTLEHYNAMGPACGACQQGVTADCFKPQCIIGDGFQKGVMSINRMIPGPAIQVCLGDQVVIDVKNMAMGTAASIHWHGLHMVDTPYMDGVPHVTQCPILYESTFRYNFKATQVGTHFYHSHSGHHKLNGQYGALIVRQPDEDNPLIDTYDFDKPEHYILISDWRHDYAENSFPGLPKGVSFPDSFLINGRGTYVSKDTFEHTVVPVTIYYIEKPGLYKFNIISSVSLTCGCTIQAEKHSFIVTATDSYDNEPAEFDTLVLNAGERNDVVIDAWRGSGDYWIRVRGLPSCQTQPTDTFALLRYITKPSDYKKPQPPFPSYHKTYAVGDSLNFPNATCFDNDNHWCVADLTALERDTDLATGEPDYKFTFRFYNYVFPVEQGFIPGKYVRFDNPEADVIASGVVNNMSLIFPPQTILTQYNEVNKSQMCDGFNFPARCKGQETCNCINMVKVKTGAKVEMTLIDDALVPDLNHPWHLHGSEFFVVGMALDPNNMTKAVETARKVRKSAPVRKDTVQVPNNGVVVVRFRANNPGVWLVHCHYELHLATGMAFLYQVGEPSEWRQPPSDFPKCGNYVPGIRKGYY
ncbi:uncharacterized protein LOC129919980 [Episyrphus balteatus]|uniref:uncharacterized protein LOC129919980 n=1 Tax=Episyrphus balteatus TaxID=286459 RepID=UPI0024852491|nr:uncharacterized protein LOC129919980 [Episyrphus balteatus]